MRAGKTPSPLILALLSALIFTVVLSGCGLGGASTSSAAPTPTVDTTDVTVPTSVDTGVTKVGTSKTSTLALTNGTNKSIVVSSIAVDNSAFKISGITYPQTIAAGSTYNAQVQFTATSSGTVTGTATVTTDKSNGNGKKIKLLGRGGQGTLTITPAQVAFGDVTVGKSATSTLTLANSGTVALNVTAMSSSSALYTLSGVTLPLTIQPGASSSVTAKYAPTATGATSASLTFTNDGTTASVAVPASGNAVAATPLLTASPTSMAFGSVNTGTTSSQALLLRNTGSAALTVSAISPSGAGFTVSGFTLPLTINAGASVAGNVVFAPTTAGAVTGSITIASNSATAVAPVALSGTGVTPSGQLAVSPTSVAFGSLNTGQTSSKQLTLSNTGSGSLQVSALTVSGTGFSTSGFTLPLTLAPGASVVGNVVFAPTAAGAASGSVTVTSSSPNAVPPVALSGTGVATSAQISVSPTAMSFGSVTTGQTATAPLTLKNTGTANLSITAVTPSGSGYSVNGFILPLTLAPGASGVGNVVFAPTTAGTLNGSIVIASNSATAAPTVSLSGTGVASSTYVLGASPASLSFGNVTVGASSSLNVTLSNSGSGSVSVTAANVTGTGYSVATTFPVTIAAGASRSIAVTFTPQLSGAANGSVSFVSNASNSPATVTLTGSGQAAVQHSVDLTWTASTSNVVGYNIYRSTVSGGPYTLLNSSPVSGTLFTDATVYSGTTYYYVVRSIDSSGVESSNSGQATAVIP